VYCFFLPPSEAFPSGATCIEIWSLKEKGVGKKRQKLWENNLAKWDPHFSKNNGTEMTKVKMDRLRPKATKILSPPLLI